MLSASTFFKQSRILCLYDMKYAIPSASITFPKATTVSIIRCSPTVIPSLLTPERFPNLKTVHYLSGHPGKVDLYRRFMSPVNWVFPNQEHDFYTRMIEAGKGRVNPDLISSYVVRQTYLRDRPHRMEFDLHIPGLDIMGGIQYRTLLYRYLYSTTLPHTQVPSCQWDLYSYQLLSQRRHSHEIYLQEKTNQAFYECLKEDDKQFNHLDATPCRNSNK